MATLLYGNNVYNLTFHPPLHGTAVSPFHFTLTKSEHIEYPLKMLSVKSHHRYPIVIRPRLSTYSVHVEFYFGDIPERMAYVIQPCAGSIVAHQ